MKIQKAFLVLPGVILIPSIIMLSACQLGQQERILPAQIRQLEITGNEINIHANRSLQPGAYIQPSPPKLILTINNADLVQGVPASGEATEGMIKAWQVAVVKSERVQGEETKEIYNVRLTADLTKNATYQLTSTDFGCKLALQDIKFVEKGPETTNIEIPKELYSKIQKMSGPSGMAVATSTPEEEKAAREMLNELVPERPTVEKLPPATTITDLSYRTIEKTFEVVITGDGEFRDFKVNTLDNPVRVYLDIFGIKCKLPKNIFQVNTGNVQQIRIGQYPEKTRVVVELKGKIKDPRIVNVKNKIVISIVY